MYISVFFSHILELAQKEGLSLEAALEGVRELGYVGAECSERELLSHPDAPALLKAQGMRLTAVHGSADLVKGDLESAAALLELAATVGAPNLLMIPGRAETVDTKQAALERISEGLFRLCKRGRELGVGVTVENFSSALAPYSTEEDLRALFDMTDGLFWTLDSGNFRCVCADPLNTSAVLISRVANVHLKDWSLTPHPTDGSFLASDGTRLYCSAVGDGIMPNAEILRLLTAVGYGGPLTVELHGPSDPRTCLKASREFIGRQLPKY